MRRPTALRALSASDVLSNETRARRASTGLRAAAPLLAATALLLAGCAGGGDWPGSPAEPAPTAPVASVDASHAPSEERPAPSVSTPTPTTADSCDWDRPAAPGTSAAPNGSVGAVRDTIVGAWQHTHIDTGEGFAPIDGADIRYVFPSADEILYCQDVPGATLQAEQRGAITWEDTTIVLPGGALRYTVTDWSDSAMVWHNHLDGSRYLLVRR